MNSRFGSLFFIYNLFALLKNVIYNFGYMILSYMTKERLVCLVHIRYSEDISGWMFMGEEP